MIILENTELRVSILHPLEDQARMGPRFCTGAYIHQVEDHVLGPLLSGPEYPHSTPSVLNGQGLPEVFQHTLFEDPESRPAKKMIIGVGLLDNALRQRSVEQHFVLPVETFCEWEILESGPDIVRMLTRDAHLAYAYELERTAHLTSRRLTVLSRLKNLSAVPIVFRWFAHPFFQLPASHTGVCVPEFSCVLPVNEGFTRQKDGTIVLAPLYPWSEGCFQMLEDVEGAVFGARTTGAHGHDIRVDGDFPMLKAALWANHNTFSIEPFFQQTLAPEHEARWSMTYHFSSP